MNIATNENYKKYINHHSGNPPKPPRYSIDVYNNFLDDQQISIITKDREKFGNYINDYVVLDLQDKKGIYYLDGI